MEEFPLAVCRDSCIEFHVLLSSVSQLGTYVEYNINLKIKGQYCIIGLRYHYAQVLSDPYDNRCEDYSDHMTEKSCKLPVGMVIMGSGS